MEPITRKEKFLAKAGGQEVSLPEPITREEMFLAAISGGGGGSGAETLIMTAPFIDMNGDTATFPALFYDDGTQALYDTAERLVNCLNAGGRCLLFLNGTRRGEIMACHVDNMVDGQTLLVHGFATNQYWTQGFKRFEVFLT